MKKYSRSPEIQINELEDELKTTVLDQQTNGLMPTKHNL